LWNKEYPMLNALSIDIEEHFQVHAFDRVVNRSDWDSYPSRVVANTQRVLSLLKLHNVRATFFILGWVANRFPDLVREIAENGHEIASHSYWHKLNYRQTPANFEEDLFQSLKALSKALQSQGSGLQTPIIGYRAPSFSIIRESLWVLDILSKNGILYDSSIFPLISHDRYGIRDASRFPIKLSNGIWEIPVSTIRMGRYNWPIAGGGYFRLFPLWITRQAIRRINNEGHPAVIYLHPWEFDPEQPRITNVSWVSRFRHYVNLDKTEERLHVLLQEFHFAPFCEVFAEKLGLS